MSGLPTLEVNGNCENNPPQDGGGNCSLVWKNANSEQQDDDDNPPIVVDDSDSDNDQISPDPVDQVQTVTLPSGRHFYKGEFTIDNRTGVVYMAADFRELKVTDFRAFIEGTGDWKAWGSAYKDYDIRHRNDRFHQDDPININATDGTYEGGIFAKSNYDKSGATSSSRNPASGTVRGRFESVGLETSGTVEASTEDGRYTYDATFTAGKLNLPSGVLKYEGDITITDHGAYPNTSGYVPNSEEGRIRIDVDFDNLEVKRLVGGAGAKSFVNASGEPVSYTKYLLAGFTAPRNDPIKLFADGKFKGKGYVYENHVEDGSPQAGNGYMSAKKSQITTIQGTYDTQSIVGTFGVIGHWRWSGNFNAENTDVGN